MSTSSNALVLRAQTAIQARAQAAMSRDVTLENALKLFEELDQAARGPDSQQYKDLTKEIVRSEVEIANSSKAGGSAILRFVMVLASIFVMICVAQLSIFYEDGQALLSDLKTFQSQRVERQISQLERRLIYAKSTQLGEDGTLGQPDGSPPPDGKKLAPDLANDMALDRYYELFFDLKDADRSVTQLMYRSQNFWDASYSPVPLLDFLVSPIRNWYFGNSYAEYVQNLPKSTAPPADPCEQYQKLLGQERISKDSMWMRLIADGRNSCLFSGDNKIANYALILPPIQEHIGYVEARLKPYSVWIMPVTFAIFGALMFYMRLIVNEFLPNPSLSRVLHRIALSALAAVVLSLFWSSLISRGGEFEAVGFTVFTLSFVIGFSIDIFFAYLDRSVAIATGALSKDDASTAKGQVVAEGAHG